MKKNHSDLKKLVGQEGPCEKIGHGVLGFSLCHFGVTMMMTFLAF
jgi:hypothetical protein